MILSAENLENTVLKIFTIKKSEDFHNFFIKYSSYILVYYVLISNLSNSYTISKFVAITIND